MMTPRATYVDAQRMLAAIGASHYCIAIRQWRRNGSEVVQPHIGPLTSQEVIGRWRVWQRRNAARADIFVRIADDPPPAVLVDDLDEEGLRRLQSDVQVVAVVETSPRNWQVWVPRPHELDALPYSRALAKRYGGDSGAVGARQPGRLPALANRKPCHARSDGLGPWIKLRLTEPAALPPGPDYVEMLLGEPRAAAAAAADPAPSGSLAARRPPPGRRNGRSASEDDWAMARRMLWQGATVDEVEAAVLAAAIKRDKPGAEQYASRTARKADGLPV